MDAVFFVGTPGDASGVRSVEDLPHEPAGDPLTIESPGALSGLVSALGVAPRGALRQLRDATCQSFPVWCFGREATAALAGLEDARIDGVAEQWQASAEDDLPDVDLYDLTLCLGAIGGAVRDGEAGARLFVLLEEKAF